MIRIVAGGKKNVGWVAEACAEYEKRLHKPFDITWQFMDEEKLLRHLASWPFESSEFVICCDERGKNISSPEFSSLIEKAFVGGKDVAVLVFLVDPDLRALDQEIQLVLILVVRPENQREIGLHVLYDVVIRAVRVLEHLDKGRAVNGHPEAPPQK